MLRFLRLITRCASATGSGVAATASVPLGRRVAESWCKARFVAILVALALVPTTVLIAAPADDYVAAALAALAAGDAERADELLADALAAAPAFTLAAALRADVLTVKAGLPSTLAAADAAPGALANWRAEAALRMLPQPSGMTLAGVHVVPPGLGAMLIAETERGQLHIAVPDADGVLRVQATHYLSIGRSGIGKQRAGDRRTPIGLYWIVDTLADHQLPARYGPMALPLDYPNVWDRRAERSGDGIWLHGTDAAAYARPPRDSDGCLVVSNPNLLALGATVTVAETPVFVVREATFVAEPFAPSREAASIAQFVHAWAEDFGARRTGIRSAAASAVFAADYPGEAGLVLVRFLLTVSTAQGERSTWKRLYLRRTGTRGAWQVSADGNG